MKGNKMSYNIDTWKVKELKDLKIPLKSFYKHERTDWYPDKEFDENGICTLESGAGSRISGYVIDGIMHVNEIKWYGEGSGSAMEFILEPALEDSEGVLIASCVWEGGSTNNKLIVKDGNVTWEDIEI